MRSVGDDRQLAEMDLCLTCFSLSGTYGGKTHRCRCVPMADDWRERGEWAGYDIPLLVEVCRLCVRGTMKSGSRWSWFACETCRSVNDAVGKSVGGERGALPLGRHSIMNGLVPSPNGIETDEMVGFVMALREMFSIWFDLADWKTAEGGRLGSAAGFAERDAVSWAEWVGFNPPSVGATVDAFCRFVGYDLPENPALDRLVDARRAFVAGGVE